MLDEAQNLNMYDLDTPRRKGEDYMKRSRGKRRNISWDNGQEFSKLMKGIELKLKCSVKPEQIKNKSLGLI